MKSYFAEYHYRLSKAAEAAGVLFDERLGDMLHGRDHGEIEQILSTMLLVNEKLMRIQQGTHLFVETEALAQWLTQSGSNIDPCHAFELGEDLFPLIIHTTGRNAVAVLCGIPLPISNMGFGCVFMNCETLGQTSMFRRSVVDSSSFAPWQFLVLGTLAYIRAVPSALVRGLPLIVKHPAHYRGLNAVSIRWDSVVTHHASPCGHLRVAHSRTLRSLRFTHKRGQTIPVRASWVGPDEDVYTVIETPKP